MKRKIIFLLAASAVLAGTAMSVKHVSAAEDPPSLRSHGNIVYKSDAGTVMLFEEDLALLRSKIFSIPAEVYDPDNYAAIQEQQEGAEE